jgi:hypothetical protein
MKPQPAHLGHNERIVPIPVDRNNSTAVHIAHYKDLGDWARHYSIVRMIVGTFFVALAFTVILSQWQHPTLAILIVAVSLALFGVLLFAVFTALTFNRMNDQIAMVNQARKDLGQRETETKRVDYWTSPGGLPIACLFILVFALVVFLWWNQ